MDYALSDEQDRFQQSVKDFVDREVKPVAREIDEVAIFPEELFKKCAANGYLGWSAMMMGVRAGTPGTSEPAATMASWGQARRQARLRVHVSRNASSGRAPGGRRLFAGKREPPESVAAP